MRNEINDNDFPWITYDTRKTCHVNHLMYGRNYYIFVILKNN